MKKKVGISDDKSVHLQIAKFTDINEKIIPFFEKYSIEGVKSLDFEDFKKVCKLIENKKHLTPLLLPMRHEHRGIKAILDIKLNMNQNRKILPLAYAACVH
jgi:hypothetical protein